MPLKYFYKLEGSVYWIVAKCGKCYNQTNLADSTYILKRQEITKKLYHVIKPALKYNFKVSSEALCSQINKQITN